MTEIVVGIDVSIERRETDQCMKYTPVKYRFEKVMSLVDFINKVMKV